MRTALGATTSVTRKNAMTVHGLTLRNTPTIQTQIQDSIDEGLSTEEAGKFLLLSRSSITVHLNNNNNNKKKKKKKKKKKIKIKIKKKKIEKAPLSSENE